MRSVARVAVLALATLCLARCDSDDPAELSSQNAELTLAANNAQVAFFFTWDLYEHDGVSIGEPIDSNGDGVVDDDDVTLWCVEAGPGTPASVPWNYAVRITLVRDGVSTQLTSEQAADDGTNRAPYDTTVGSHTQSINNINLSLPKGRCSGNALIRCNPNGTGQVCSDHGAGVCDAVFACVGGTENGTTPCDPNGQANDVCDRQGAGVCTSVGVCSDDRAIPCGPICAELHPQAFCVNPTEVRRFAFSTEPGRRRILSAANRELLAETSNLIHDTCVGDALCEFEAETNLGLGPLDPQLGLCPGTDSLGDSALDPLTEDLDPDPDIFGLTLLKGDAITVEARLSDVTPGGNVVIPFLVNPGIRARLFVDGTVVQPDEIDGNLVSQPDDPSPNIVFTFVSK